MKLFFLECTSLSWFSSFGGGSRIFSPICLRSTTTTSSAGWEVRSVASDTHTKAKHLFCVFSTTVSQQRPKYREQPAGRNVNKEINCVRSLVSCLLWENLPQNWVILWQIHKTLETVKPSLQPHWTFTGCFWPLTSCSQWLYQLLQLRQTLNKHAG